MLAALLAMGAAACDGGSDSSPTTTSLPRVATTEAPVERVDDGVLRIGVLLPRSGSGASLGEPLVRIVEAAARRVNDDGGVLGAPIDIVLRDEGEDADSANIAASELIDAGVDAIIGPGSSTVALAVAPVVTGAGVLACSPLATSALLTGMPDEGRFVRTVPSDRLQAAAMASRIDNTGFREASLVFPDDIYGRTFGAAVRDALQGIGIAILGEHSYSAAGDDFGDVAGSVAADRSPVVALVAGSADATQLVVKLATASDTPPLIVANDALRGIDLGGLRTSVDGAEGQISGVSIDPYVGGDEVRRLLGLDGGSEAPAFGAQAVDCLNLFAISAIAAAADSPDAIAAQFASTTRGGTSCRDVSECRTLLESGRDIDYDGPSGLLALDANGDPLQASFLGYVFDADGRGRTVERFTIGAV